MKKLLFIGLLCLILGFVFYLKTHKSEYELKHSNDVVATLDSLNTTLPITKFVYVLDSVNNIVKVDTVELPILFNDLDSTVFVNYSSDNFTIYDLQKNTLIISDKELSIKDALNTKSLVVL